ncbi:alpha/beta fold hydrolase [Marinicella rhabdoformis]|uniref:alpha/beta fold hydrolase n=1 Tax=Marinicella rhabdoformis TaxID=2580566 RepID=UPI0015D0AB36|nr:alpha/beta fold hydrolase [Marinicella rhabdoformis]
MKTNNKQFTLSIPSFALHHGGQSGDLFVRCSLFGDIDLPVVVVLGGISANHLVSDDAQTSEKGWWRDVVNHDTFLNGKQVAVLSFEYITLKEESKMLSTHDQANVLASIHQQLNIPAFLSVIGCSYGGMVAQAFASTYPQLTHSLINLVAAHKNSIRSQALRLIQRQIMSLADDSKTNSQHTACARALAIMTYRGVEEFDQRFDNLSEAQSYLEHNGNVFAQRFSSRRYAQLSASIDTHEIDPSSIKTPTLIIATDSDQLVPVSLVKAFADQVSAPCECHIIPSAFGHDGFLKEHQAIKPLLAHFLSQLISEQSHDATDTNHWNTRVQHTSHQCSEQQTAKFTNAVC